MLFARGYQKINERLNAKEVRLKKVKNAKQFFRRFQQLDWNGDIVRQLTELATGAILGHPSPCPVDTNNCDDCDCHYSRTLSGVTVRICRRNEQVCCVEWPVMKIVESSVEEDNAEGQIRDAFRLRVSHTNNHEVFIGVVCSLDKVKKAVHDSLNARQGETCR